MPRGFPKHRTVLTGKDGRVFWTKADLARLIAGLPDEVLENRKISPAEFGRQLEMVMKAVMPPDRWKSLPALQRMLTSTGPQEQAKVIRTLCAKTLRDRRQADPANVAMAAALAEVAGEAVAPAAPDKRRVMFSRAELSLLAHHSDVKALIDSRAEPGAAALTRALTHAERLVLPADRRKGKTAWSKATAGARRLILLAKLREAIKFNAPRPPMPAPVVVEPAPVPVLQPAPAPVSAEPTLRELLTPLVRPLIHEAIRDELSQLESRLMGQVRQTLIELLGGPSPVEATPAPQPAPVVEAPPGELVRPRKIRVDIIGLLGAQAEVVKAQASELFDLRFVETRDMGKLPITADHAVMMTKFVSHQVQNKIKRSGAMLHYANGATESVLASLKKISGLASIEG